MTAPQSTCSCFQNQAFDEFVSNINKLRCYLVTLHGLGELFLDIDELCLSGCAIRDYMDLSIPLLEEIALYSSSLAPQYHFPACSAADDHGERL